MSDSPTVRTVLSDVSSPDPLHDSLSDPRSFITTSPKRQTASLSDDYRNRKSASLGRRGTSSATNTPQKASVSSAKTVTEQTLSPWKIRVTVEAEPEETDLAGQMQTITCTTTIPLRTDSSPLQASQTTNESRTMRSGSRTRSRVGSASAVRTRQRSSTPNTGRRRRQSVTDLDIVVLGDDGAENEWGRKSRQISPTRARRRSSKAERNPRGISSVVEVIEAAQNDGEVDRNRGSKESYSKSPQLREIDLNRVSVRPRGNSFKQKALVQFKHDRSLPSKENVETCLETTVSGQRKVSANSTRSYPTPSPTPSESDSATSATSEAGHAEGFDTIMESEGFTMIDLDSIPSVQQIRSSPLNLLESQAKSGSNQTVQRFQVDQTGKASFPTPGKSFPSYLHLAEGESDISSALPSSPPLSVRQSKQRQSPAVDTLRIPSSMIASRYRQVTPQTYSSPRLPSPPRPALLNERTPPDSSKALKAGATLQSAVQPETQPVMGDNDQHTGSETVETRIDSRHPALLFEGFDSNAQRELRAGLRFGEELAKRQNPAADDAQRTLSKPDASNVPVENDEQVLEQKDASSRLAVKSNVINTPQQTQIRKSSLLSRVTVPSDHSMQDASQCDQELYEEETKVSRRELLWQKQRMEVIREALNTNSDNVIIIEGDSNVISKGDEVAEIQDVTMQDDDGEDGDIWLAEAKHASSSPRNETEQTTSQESHREPQRSTSYCKDISKSIYGNSDRPNQYGNSASSNGGGTSFIASVDGDTSISGLLWYVQQDQESDVRFGAGQIKDTRRELRKPDGSTFGDRTSSGIFDLDKMLATPKRIRESLEQQKKERQEGGRDKQLLAGLVDKAITTEDSLFCMKESSPQNPPLTVPVKFNDAVSSIIDTPPVKLRASLSPSKLRPATPRSAFRGSRQSFGYNEPQDMVDHSEPSAKRVIWARKSNHMNEEWIESSRSMISDSSSVREEIPKTMAAQLHELTLESEDSEARSHVIHEPQQSSQVRDWLGWFRGERLEDRFTSASNAPSTGKLAVTDGTLDREDNAEFGKNSCEEFSQRVISARDSDVNTEQVSQSPVEMRTKMPIVKLPSYLLPLSYPADPRRPLTSKMSTFGQFTNTHFRTLHIIYAKSSRPRFHAPQIEECRPEIRKLVTEKWRFYVDEERAGLGGFEFKFGEKEGRVVERFCREVEWSNISGEHGNGKIQLADLIRATGIWSGCSHGGGEVSWEWSCEQLAEWLGRIVVGEVVREEEHGGKGCSQDLRPLS